MTRDQQTGLYAKYLGRFLGLSEIAETAREALTDKSFVDRMITIMSEYNADENKLNQSDAICGDLPTLKAQRGGVMSDREKQLDRIDDRNAQVDAMTTDTKPSEAAMKIARKMCQGQKIYLYGGLPEFCGHNYGWAGEKDIALLIDAGVREMREALERILTELEFGAEDQSEMTHAEKKIYKHAETALRAWRPK